MERPFAQINEAFDALKARFQAGEIPRQEFIDEMKKLRIRDGQGRFWMIGAQTGKWYFFDGKDWIPSEPPSQKDNAAICIYCGFENRIDANACERCGGTIGEEPTKCPDCGTPLRKPFMTCPRCAAALHGTTPEPAPPTTTEIPLPGTAVGEAVLPPSALPASVATAPVPSAAAEPAFAAAPSGELVVTSVQPASLFFFWGGFGLLAGVIAGAFFGATGRLKPQLSFLPLSLQQLQGTLFGAIIDAVAGGIMGFLALGSLAYVLGFLANIIRAMTGGVQVRTRPAGVAEKTKAPRELSL